jgi:2-polyprenyl-3-methyl-5-hydroxy-6-metoxy-1,4-benzoquinol methylase
LAKLFLDKDNLKTVIDIGCGSGYKLLKYFKENDFYGFEVNPTFSFLQENYPNNNWRNIEAEDLSNYTADIVISSDVIEHIDNPIPYLENILKIKGVQYYFFSTPEKFSLYGKKDFGPPSNLHHFREWDSFEFNEFMSKFFDIKYHFMSNFEQNTQLIIAKRKNI